MPRVAFLVFRDAVARDAAAVQAAPTLLWRPGPVKGISSCTQLDPMCRAGDPLDANIEGGRIVLTPRLKRPHRVKLVIDPVTGFPALSAGANAPTLSSKEVEEILANFP